MTNNEDNHHARQYGLVVFLLGFICLLPLVYYIVRFWTYNISDNPLDFGPFGDYIGGAVGAASGLISVIFLYKTYQSQLSFSRSQVMLSSKQQFESTFFSLLAQQRDIRQNMSGHVHDGPGRPKNLEDNDYWIKMRKDLSKRLMDLQYELDSFRDGKEYPIKIKVADIYQDFFDSHANQLGHYFRHLYHLLKYVDESSIKDIHKKGYVDIVQAQMSSDELYICAVNGISNLGRKRMLPLLDKYSFLENLVIDDDDIISSLVSMFYPNTKMKSVDSHIRNIVFVGGVHGVGKSTFINEVIKELPSYKQASCSAIIKWKNPREKEVEDVRSSQDKLIENLPFNIDIDIPYLLDGHFCLLNKDRNVECLPVDVFHAINPAMVILLEDDAPSIVERLRNRDGIEYPEELIESFIKKEKEHAHIVASELNVPLMICKSSEYKSVLEDLRLHAKKIME